MYAHHVCKPRALESHRKAQNPLELDLPVVLSHCVGT